MLLCIASMTNWLIFLKTNNAWPILLFCDVGTNLEFNLHRLQSATLGVMDSFCGQHVGFYKYAECASHNYTFQRHKSNEMFLSMWAENIIGCWYVKKKFPLEAVIILQWEHLKVFNIMLYQIFPSHMITPKLTYFLPTIISSSNSKWESKLLLYKKLFCFILVLSPCTLLTASKIWLLHHPVVMAILSFHSWFKFYFKPVVFTPNGFHYACKSVHILKKRPRSAVDHRTQHHISEECFIIPIILVTNWELNRSLHWHQKVKTYKTLFSP